MRPTVPCHGRKGKRMKLRIRYENELQILELNAEDTEKLWVSLSLEGEGLSQDEKEQLIQDTWEERFNKPEYNCWHKHDRHSGAAVIKNKDGSKEVNTDEAVYERAADKTAFTKSIDAVEDQMVYEDWCKRIRAAMKQDYAEMIIAIHLDGMEPCEYAESIGEKPNTLNHRLQRAEKKFKEIFPRTSF